MKFRTLAVFMTLSVVFVLAACGQPAEEPIDPLTIGDPQRGQDIFETGGDILSTSCSRCHNLAGDEIMHESGPSLEGISEVAGTRVKGQSSVDYLRESILDPSAYVVEGYDDGMEKFYELLLSEEDVNALVAFLLTQ